MDERPASGDASTSEAAWQRLLGALDGAGRLVTGPLGARDERERAEGFRHLTRILSVATEMLLEKGDRERPAFTRWMNPHRKLLGDNPHTIYDAAVIAPSHTYRIAGRRGSTTYLGICVYGTGEGGARRIVGNLDDVDLALGEDSTFEVWLAPERPADLPGGAGFLRLDDDATDVMVRQYRLDPESETLATYEITAVPSLPPPPAFTEEELARRLDAVGAFVRDIVEVETSLSALISTATPAVLRHGSEYVAGDGAATAPPVDPAVVARAMPSPAIQYSGTWFDDLGDEEVVVVSGSAPVCRYWSVQVLSRFMESGDYDHHPVFLAGDDIVVGDDGTFEVAVAHDDPGATNWVSTGGWRSASIAVRALLAEGVLDVDYRREPRGS